ncbi:MAG: hypothetical protein AB7V16_03200 [Vulcanibacillus sp.]
MNLLLRYSIIMAMLLLRKGIAMMFIVGTFSIVSLYQHNSMKVYRVFCTIMYYNVNETFKKRKIVEISGVIGILIE